MNNLTTQPARNTETTRASYDTGSTAPTGPGDLLLAPPGRGELILIVDDDEPVRDMISAVLTEHGYRTLTAASGIEAISIFISHHGRIDAVFTDIRMPLMDGVGLCQQLKKLRPDVCILAGSGQYDPAKREELHALRVRCVLAKPFSAGSLLLALGEMLHPTHAPFML